ncbi:MAG: hypothetical protein QXY74_05795 [Candidatus Bathyarchaeia archaeon]
MYVRAKAVNSEDRKAGSKAKESTYNPKLTTPIGKETAKSCILIGPDRAAKINAETNNKVMYEVKIQIVFASFDPPLGDLAIKCEKTAIVIGVNIANAATSEGNAMSLSHSTNF